MGSFRNSGFKIAQMRIYSLAMGDEVQFGCILVCQSQHCTAQPWKAQTSIISL